MDTVEFLADVLVAGRDHGSPEVSDSLVVACRRHGLLKELSQARERFEEKVYADRGGPRLRPHLSERMP